MVTFVCFGLLATRPNIGHCTVLNCILLLFLLELLLLLLLHCFIWCQLKERINEIHCVVVVLVVVVVRVMVVFVVR